jgi:hypothetical protein
VYIYPRMRHLKYPGIHYHECTFFFFNHNSLLNIRSQRQVLNYNLIRWQKKNATIIICASHGANKHITTFLKHQLHTVFFFNNNNDD